MSKLRIAALAAAPLVLLYVSLFIGRYPLPPLVVIQMLASKAAPFLSADPSWTESMYNVLFTVRLPRAVMAAAVGASLALSGASFQGMFRNPLVSPDILGISSAAGFGAAVAILWSGSREAIQVMAFGTGVLGVVLAYAISRVYKTTPILMLVLSGMVVGTFFSALTSGTKFIADTEQRLPAITFWLMGSFAAISPSDLITTIPPMALGAATLLLLGWRINVLSMGEDDARSLGINTELLKSIVIVCCTVLTSASVSVSGVIGWVGLLIPHVARMLVGPDHRVMLPTALSLGACYMLVIDDVARTVTPSEIPLGILTAVIGAPFFVYLIRKTKGAWT